MDKWAEWIQEDWDNHVALYANASGGRYLHEGGKPVVCIFGLGLSNHAPMPEATDALALIQWLKARAYVIGSGPYWWRTGCHDAAKGYDAVHAAFDAVMPWSVGRYGDQASFSTLFRAQAVGDAGACSQRGQGYAPIAFPGYSFHNSNPSRALNQIPRCGGSFLQAQADAYLQLAGATFYYVAMFDEVNEGTAVFKAAAEKADCPANVGFVYHGIDGGGPFPSDFYLKKVQQFTAGARASTAAATV